MRKMMTSALAATAALALATSAQAANWTNPGTGDWSDAANWDTVLPPSGAEFVNISNGGTAQVTGNESAGEIRMSIGTTSSGGLEVNGGGTLTHGSANFGWQGATTVTVNSGTISSANVNMSVTGTGTVAAVVTGPSSSWTSNAAIWVGNAGVSSLQILNGATVNSSTGFTVAGGQNMEIARSAAASGSTVLVDGAGSELIASSSLLVGASGAGELTIQNQGLVHVLRGTVTINFDEAGDDSFLNMRDVGSRLALRNNEDKSGSLAEFLELVNPGSGDGIIRYWNGVAFDDIANATLGVDYTLTYETTGDLAGSNILTIIPEPASLGLLAMGGLLMLARRRKA